MFEYGEARALLIRRLSQAAVCHEAGNYEELGTGFEEMDMGLPRRKGPEFLKLYTALNFWEGWIDASNHQWKYYRGIDAKDWPVLARRIVADLQADRHITDSLVLERFSPNSRPVRSAAQRVLVFLSTWTCLAGTKTRRQPPN